MEGALTGRSFRPSCHFASVPRLADRDRAFSILPRIAFMVALQERPATDGRTALSRRGSRRSRRLDAADHQSASTPVAVSHQALRWRDCRCRSRRPPTCRRPRTARASETYRQLLGRWHGSQPPEGIARLGPGASRRGVSRVPSQASQSSGAGCSQSPGVPAERALRAPVRARDTVVVGRRHRREAIQLIHVHRARVRGEVLGRSGAWKAETDWRP